VAWVSERLGLRPGDIFMVDGGSWFDNVIEWFQTVLSGNRTWARWSHTGVIVAATGRILETTSWRTGYRSLAEHYAGSRIKILRWPGMTPDLARDGLACVADQVGRIYPYWRLLTHALGLEAKLHGRAMDCTTLAAFFLKWAWFPLSMTPWAYGPRELADEMEARGCAVVFNGRLRAAGYIEE
jgi:hypothetical protein